MKSLFIALFVLSSFTLYGSPEPKALVFEPRTFSHYNSEEIGLSSPLCSFRQKSSFAAVGLSVLLPGLGHAYLGDMKTAGDLLGAFTNIPTTVHAWFYSFYASYRDVRSYNEEMDYFFQMPKDSFNDLALAPFQWSVIKKKEVWGGLLGAFALGIGAGYLARNNNKDFHIGYSTTKKNPFSAFSVAIGEEALFRGWLQPMFNETFSPVGGIILSSLAFGAAHIPNADLLPRKARRNYYTYALPDIIIFGLYTGWLSYKNHSLKESVAIHAWYDFVIFLAANAVAETSITKKPSFSFSFSF